MHKRNYRIFQILITMLTLLVLSASFYFQYVQGLHPCPLCLMQRVCVFGLFFFSLMGIYSSTHKRARLVNGMQMISALAGIFFASRQLWLQSLPPGQGVACVPGLDILIHYFPWQDIATALLWGTGDCGEVQWHWLGLSMPGWALLYFVAMFIVAFFLFVKAGNRVLD